MRALHRAGTAAAAFAIAAGMVVAIALNALAVQAKER